MSADIMERRLDAIAMTCNTLAVRDGEQLARTDEWWQNVRLILPDEPAFVLGCGIAAITARLEAYRQVVADACAPWFEVPQ